MLGTEASVSILFSFSGSIILPWSWPVHCPISSHHNHTHALGFPLSSGGSNPEARSGWCRPHALCAPAILLSTSLLAGCKYLPGAMLTFVVFGKGGKEVKPPQQCKDRKAPSGSLLQDLPVSSSSSSKLPALGEPTRVPSIHTNTLSFSPTQP